MQPKILITVRGGLIATISANDPNIQITVADYDNQDCYENASDLFQYYKSSADDILPDNVLDLQIIQLEEDFKTEMES